MVAMTNSPENGSAAPGLGSSAPSGTRVLSKVAAVLLTIPLPGVPQLWRGDYLKGGMLLALTAFGYATCSVTGMFFHTMALVDVGYTRTGRFIKNAKLRMLIYRLSFAGGFLAMWEASAWEIGPKKWICVEIFSPAGAAHCRIGERRHSNSTVHCGQSFISRPGNGGEGKRAASRITGDKKIPSW